VDGPVLRRSVVPDVEEDGMRIVRDGSCLDDVKCGTIFCYHRDKLEDIDQDKSTRG
jgi:hypothetical protein